MPSLVSRASRRWLHPFREQVLGTARYTERLPILAAVASDLTEETREKGCEGLWNSRQLEAKVDSA